MSGYQEPYSASYRRLSMEPLRSKVGGASKPSPDFAGWDRLGIAVYSLQLIVNSLRLISWLFADNLQISCDFLGGFEKKA